jgi:hypothetical protein
MALTVITTFMLFVLATLAWATTQPSAAESSTELMRVSDFPHGCKSAARAIRHYKRVTQDWQHQRNAITGSAKLARKVKWPNCARAVKAAQEWVARAVAARRAYWTLFAYEYDWRAWMPTKHQRVAACETGHQGGTGPEGASWTWDSGRYVSAFGIYRSGYDADAHRVGNLGWDETLARLHRYATPREQMQAADSHRAANGGWGGWGCRGA